MRKPGNCLFLGLLRLFLFLLFVSVVATAQKPLSKNARELIVWQQRTDDLTDSVVKDIGQIENSERAIYLALLAKIWWKFDLEFAQKYLKRSIETTLKDLDSDEDVDLSKKLKTSQKVLQIAAALDEKSSQFLVERIAKILETKGKSDKGNADSFILVALQIVDKNPQLAFQLGTRSLTYGNSLQLGKLILGLTVKESTLAENLYRSSLFSARRNYSYGFTGSLGIVFQTYKNQTLSDAARRSYLEYLADIISDAALTDAGHSKCEVITLATPILSRFDEYLPNRTLLLRQQIDICIPFSHPYTAEIAKTEARGEEPRDADEFIRAARDTPDPGKKAHYFYRAIALLDKAKKIDDIVSLLDGMTEPEVTAMGDGWNSWRIKYGCQSALDAVEASDMPSAYRAIDRTPKKNRPYVRFCVARKLSLLDQKGFYLENLEEIQKETGSLEIPPRDSASNYLSLARMYLKVQPTQSERMLRAAVKAINAADNENPEFLPEKDYAPLMDIVSLPYELLEVDEYSIFSSFSDISSRRSRARLKIGLLESCLQKLADVKKKVESELKEKKKS